MASIGQMNTLTIIENRSSGAYLDGGDLGKIFLPRKDAPESTKPGETLNVFVYLDSEDRLAATTRRPLATVGEFAFMNVVSTTPVGAFLDWGLPKDLFVPHREQRERMRVGRSYLVFVYMDVVSNRMAASTRLNRHMSKDRPSYHMGQEVSLIVAHRTRIGTMAIIEQAHWGVLFHNESVVPLSQGQSIRGFVKRVREDGKVDLALQQPGYGKVTDLTRVILNYLKEQGGFIPVTDRTSPRTISDLFGVSKKTYKKAVGALYRKRMIDFEENGTRLIGLLSGDEPEGSL